MDPKVRILISFYLTYFENKVVYLYLLILTGAELSRLPLDRTIFPRTSTPSVVIFPAALMDFSPTAEQSNTTFTDVLLTVTWSCDRARTRSGDNFPILNHQRLAVKISKFYLNLNVVKYKI